MVGKSDFTNQNQQIIEFNVFDITTLYIKVNTSAQYSNSYNLSITLGPIDDQYEPNDNPLQSATLFQPGVYNLYLAKNNWDYFRIFLFNQDQLNATIQFHSSIANNYL